MIPSFRVEKRISHQDILNFAESVGLNRIAAGRYSILFVLQLYEYMDRFSIHPEEIIREVEFLEGLKTSSATKSDTVFKHPPLKGLHHKHFFSSRFIPKNIQNEIAREIFDNDFDNVLKAASPCDDPMSEIKKLTNKIIHETISSRMEQNRLTGEYFIFAKHNNQNYYLALTTHNAGDKSIYEQISHFCFREFPFLEKQLNL